MNKKYFISIPLIALCVIAILSGNVYSLGHYKGVGNTLIGGSVRDCNFCHDFANGVYDNPGPGQNLRWVKTTITFCSISNNIACVDSTDCPTGETCTFGRPVKFTTFEDTTPPIDGTLADGNNALLDGPCEVCHTGINYHNNSSPSGSHYDGLNCTGCHPHFLDDITNYFEPRFVGGQSHYTHFTDPKGPQLGLDACFTACHKSSSNFQIFKDNNPIATTTVCDDCHSPGGSFNGVGDMNPGNPNSVAYGAKYNWVDGIYEPAVAPELWPSRLKSGKENWCAGCHDNGSSVVNGVSAPNVMGNNNTYGYNKTGHGRNPINPVYCGDCHDLAMLHTDGNSRTYSANNNNYRSGYRLNKNIVIPRLTAGGLHSYDLCTDCHNDVKAPDPFSQGSGFRNDDRGLQLHKVHLLDPNSGVVCWDSDWNGTTANCTGANEGDCADSTISCTACHNVHGSPCLDQFTIVQCLDPLKAPMIRHGELISSPGTSNKVPAFRFNWYTGDMTHTTVFNDSYWGGMICAGPFDVMYNKVCWGCHDRGEVLYHRSPSGPEMVKIYNIRTTDLNDMGQTTFAPGEDIRYHVSFNVNGASTYFIKAYQSKAKSINGSSWSTSLTKNATVPGGDYEWTWDKKIPKSCTTSPPPCSTSGQDAQVTITLQMFPFKGSTTVISTDTYTVPFKIQ